MCRPRARGGEPVVKEVAALRAEVVPAHAGVNRAEVDDERLQRRVVPAHAGVNLMSTVS